jgi:hypothetical protein
MPRPRKEKTLADYVAIAISPALIITLVGSLVFFLLELSYKGEYAFRMKWILFCFVPASILVARIAIEQGKEHASIFGGALALAAGLGMMRFVDAVVIAWILLAVIWWCGWKLTWDCTLIDDDEDASGEGLLQAAGIAAEPASRGRQPPDLSGDYSRNASGSESGGSRKRQKDDVAGRGQEGESGGLRPRLAGESEPGHSPRRPPHAPGLWVVYFSLAALPLFGIGQLFIPATNVESRAYSFQLLAVYVASALGLLLTTSFLGLRRYLRQRKLEMPLAMTGTWIGMGAGLAVALMLLALLIPRPQGDYTLTALIEKLDSKVRDASRLAVLGGDKAKGEGRRIGEQDQKAKPGDFRQHEQNKAQQQDQRQGQPQQQANQDGKQQGQQAGNGKEAAKGEQRGDGKGAAKGEQKGNDNKGNADGKGKGEGQAGQKQDQAGAKARPGEQQRQGEQGAKINPNHPPPPTPSASGLTSFLAQLAPLFKWLVYGALALVGLYLLIRHWSRLMEILGQLWAELLSLFGRKPETSVGAAGGAEEQQKAPPRPFASFEDPFFSGAARRMPPAQLVRYTFEALEAWAREQVVARPADQTPLEFAQELSRRLPAIAKDVNQTAQLYDHVAYARRAPTSESVEILERMWRRMQLGANA